ncbi:MAG TPA: aminotransferase class V-fold PLP-dependent enzyme [Roseiarcus sp.]|nr:aminotransferase class V-fold PLP-dependent enzyme [Roseiarcus sp.]
MRFYLDYNATAPLRPEARAAMIRALDEVGNPSSIHFEGRAARARVEEARREVAGLAGSPPRDIVFTASGTEAANLALAPGVSAPGVAPLRRLIVAAAEHPCVLGGHRFASAEVAAVGPDGRLDLAALARLLDDGPPALVALQGANNETGVLQPVAEAAKLAHARGGLVICDAAQVAGRLPLAEVARGADALLLSAHKFGGPKGAGAFIALREGLHVEPLLRGGGQERGRRAGTENVAAIAGFGAAMHSAGSGLAEEAARLAALRDACAARLLALAPEAVVFGAAAARLPNTLAFAIPGLAAATLLMRLDLDGIAASSGSACSSGKVGPSHVLAAMGVAPALAAGAIRISLGWASGEADVEAFGEVLENTLATLRRKAG